MKKSLLRRMAPLVAGVLFVVPVVTASAAYAQITGISWPVYYPDNQYCTVSVNSSPSYPYIAPKADSENYIWWFDGTRTYAYYSDHYTTATVYPLTVTNVCVYVYGDDSSGDVSYAISDRDTGVYIWNGS